MITVVTLAVLGWLALHFLILPHIERWRPEIEQRASATVGVAVRIGRIDVQSNGIVPSLALQDVVLLDVLQREALRLPRISATVSPRSLLSLQLRFSQLLIEGAALDLRRDSQDRFYVAGLEIGGTGGGPGDTSALDWFFKQREFVIRHGSLTWTDERRNIAALSLRDVDVVVRNGLFRHDIRIDATPPQDWGERFSLRGRFTQGLLDRAGDWTRWTGEAYVDLPRADVRQLRERITLPFDLQEGHGAVRAWIDLRQGVARRATVDLALRDVALRLRADAGAEPLAPLAFEELEGRVVGLYDKDRSSVSVEQFGFVTAAMQRWPKSDMSLAWDGPPDGAPRGGVLTAQRLDLGLMAQIADGLPLGDGLRRQLTELEPEGVVTGLQFNWTGPIEAPTRYQLKAGVADLSLQAGPIPPSRPLPAVGGLPAGMSHELGRPGFRNVAVQISANERGGDADVTMADGQIDLPGVFDEPQVPIDRLTTRLNWRLDPPAPNDPNRQLRVQARSVRLVNADAEGEFDVTWRVGLGTAVQRPSEPWVSVAAATARPAFPQTPNGPTSHLGVIDLSGRLMRAKADRVYRYLPVELPWATRHYVDRAIRGGTIDTATFSVKGDLTDFPFFNPKAGEFRLEARARDIDYDYVPIDPPPRSSPNAPATAPAAVAWPAATRVSGQVVIDRNAMQLRNLQGRIFGVELGNVNAGIADLADKPVLTLDGVAKGSASDFMRFVRATPINEWIGHALDEATIGGNTDMTVSMRMPMDDMNQTTVKGTLNASGNDLRLGPGIPALMGARGRVEFTDKGFAIAGGAVRVLGGDATFEGGSQADGSIRFNGQGTVTVDALRRAAELGFVQRVAGSLSGQASYKLALGFVKGQAEVDVTSNLVGVESTLPAPMRKPPQAPMALHYQTTLQPDSLVGGAYTRDTMKVEVGNVLQAVYQRELKGAASSVLRGSIGVMDAASLPDKGVSALVRLPTLDVSAWEKVMDRLVAESNAGPAALSSAPASASSPAAMAAPNPGNTANTANTANAAITAGSGDDYIPDTIALVVDQLDVSSRKLSHVVAGISQSGGVWKANVDADQLSGYAEYRPPGRVGDAPALMADSTAGLVYARLARLQLPESEVGSVENLLDEQPVSIPALDIVVDNFELRGMKLGRIDMEASNRSEGRNDPSTRVWTLSRLNVSSPDGQLSATGKWLPERGGARKGQRLTQLDFKLDLVNGGAFLDRLGFEKVVRGAKGTLAGQISWTGSPLSIDYPSMGGKVNVQIAQGQFLKVNPGAARLLGVLSLQSIPRRLTLDFRDLFQEGFAFDSVVGDVTVNKGVASTNNLRMRGAQAAVLMAGSADINAETSDLRVVIVPEINAGTASLAYAVINPAIGLGTFLAQMFLKQPLTRAGTREFHIGGSWDDPKIDRVARRLGDPIPDFAGAAASAPGPADAASDAMPAASAASASR